MEKEALLSVAEISEKLNVGDDTVLSWLRQGKLKGYRLGPKLYRVRPEDLTRFLEERLVAA